MDKNAPELFEAKVHLEAIKNSQESKGFILSLVFDESNKPRLKGSPSKVKVIHGTTTHNIGVVSYSSGNKDSPADQLKKLNTLYLQQESDSDFADGDIVQVELRSEDGNLIP